MYEYSLALQVIDLTDWLRLSLIYIHLIACAFSISAILKTDISLLLHGIDHDVLKRTADNISKLLLVLWTTGLIVIYLDTGFQPDHVMSSSKLLLKLLCVSVLTLNGLVLHHLSFPILVNKRASLSFTQLILIVVSGGLSTSHWLLAAFVGLSKPLGQLSIETLLSSYILFLIVVIGLSLLCIPFIERYRLIRVINPLA